MSSIFSLRIIEFPKDLHRDYVLKYMFSVSLPIIAPLLGLVLYVTRNSIAKPFIRVKKRFVLSGWIDETRRKKRERFSKQYQKDDATSSNDPGARQLNGTAGLWRRKRGVTKETKTKGNVDEEKGIQLTEHDNSGQGLQYFNYRCTIRLDYYERRPL